MDDFLDFKDVSIGDIANFKNWDKTNTTVRVVDKGKFNELATKHPGAIKPHNLPMGGHQPCLLVDLQKVPPAPHEERTYFIAPYHKDITNGAIVYPESTQKTAALKDIIEEDLGDFNSNYPITREPWSETDSNGTMRSIKNVSFRFKGNYLEIRHDFEKDEFDIYIRDKFRCGDIVITERITNSKVLNSIIEWFEDNLGDRIYPDPENENFTINWGISIKTLDSIRDEVKEYERHPINLFLKLQLTK